MSLFTGRGPRPIELDFIRSRRGVSAFALLLLLAGLAALVASGLQVEREIARRDVLSDATDRLDAVTRPKHAAAGNEAFAAAEAIVRREHAVPWFQLLDELETTSVDLREGLSVLSIEPDVEKHVVAISIEARGLPDVVDFLERLPHAGVLRDPAIESHETNKDEPLRPVRAHVVAGWRQ